MSTVVYGDIQDRFGFGINDCWVTAKDNTTSTEYYDSDAGGSYSITVDDVSHQFTVTVWHSGYIVTSQDVNVYSGDLNQCDFAPTSGYQLNASIEGTVQDDEGLPVEDAFVWGNGNNYKFGTKTNSNGDYALPLHKADTYTIKATKNNSTVISNGDVTQSGMHPTTSITKDFTGSYCLARILGTVDLGYAVYGRSVVISDNLTAAGLTHVDDPATTTVYMKTRIWGGGGTLYTSTDDSDTANEGDGSDGTDYDGDCGGCGE